MTRPGYVFALDPSKSTCGVALFRDGQLIVADLVRVERELEDELAHCRYVANEVLEWLGRPLPHVMRQGWQDFTGHFVTEWPQAYRGAKAQAPPADLMPMCAIAGAAAQALSGATCQRVLPSEWGASGKPKPGKPYAVEIKVRARLSAIEAMRLTAVPKSLSHNQFDAVAVGLHVLDRGLVSARKRVIAR